MEKLSEGFLIGSYKGIFKVTSNEDNPLRVFFELMFKAGYIDGLLTCNQNGTEPKFTFQGEEIEIPSINAFFGINSLLKKAVQKYRFSKIAVLAPACIFDGLNKTQYFGIGCNWTKTAIALKVGIFCPGSLSLRALELEMVDLIGVELIPDRFFIKNANLYYQVGKRSWLVPLNVHRSYVNTACRYCLNPSAKGTDLTYVPLENENEALFIIRSERGWSTVAKIQLKFHNLLSFKKASGKDFENLVHFLKEKLLFNAGDIIQRVELGLPFPKWSDNKLRKFYRIWNSVDVSLGEEDF